VGVIEPFSKTIDVADDLEELARIAAELNTLWTTHGLPDDLEIPVSLALEEVLSNVLRHGRIEGHSSRIRVAFTIYPGSFEFEVSDAANPFNPLLMPDPELDLPLEQRQPGGLGVFLVKRLADELAYCRRDGRNHLRFKKSFPANTGE